MKFSRPQLAGELADMQPEARLALEGLQAWLLERGWPGPLVTEVLSERDGWARAGCSWAVRLRVYSRAQRQAIRAQLAAGRHRPEWEIEETGDSLRCTIRDFTWRASRLGTKERAS